MMHVAGQGGGGGGGEQQATGNGGAAAAVPRPPPRGGRGSASTLRLDAYSPMETLERQYAQPVGKRVMLFVHVNGNACYITGGVEALMQQRSGTATAAPFQEATASDATTQQHSAPSADPFSFLNQAEGTISDTTTTSPPTSGNNNTKGFRNFFSKVAQSTTKHLERGMTHLAIRADRGKSPDKLMVALVDVDASYVLGVTEARPVPAATSRDDGLRFATALYIPGTVPHTARVQCQLYLKSGGATTNLLWQAKPFWVASTPLWTVQQLRAAAFVPQQPGNNNNTTTKQWTTPLQSNVVVDGKMTIAVLADAKFPALTGPGWSLADPSLHAYQPAIKLFDYPLDQSYAMPLTLPTMTTTTSTNAPSVVDSLTVAPNNNPNQPVPPPAATSLLVCTERTTESAVVLPLAAAWWNALVAPAVQASFAHATAIATRVAHYRHDTPNPNTAVETHVTIHQFSSRPAHVMIWNLETFERACIRLNDVVLGPLHDEIDESLASWGLVKQEFPSVKYLARRHQVSVNTASAFNTNRKNEQKDHDQTNVSHEEQIFKDPDAIVARNDNSEGMTWEWHLSIVYSETWQAPVLYFHVQDLKTGEPCCSRTRIVEYLSSIHASNRGQDTWDFVSQEEHPLTRMPSFFLHPCRTNEHLQHLSSTIQDPVVVLLQWMSIILPSAGLAISSTDFVKATRVLTASTTLDTTTAATTTMKRVSIHCQRADSIFEVEWGAGNVAALNTSSTQQPASLPPPATVLGYPKPVTSILPALQQQPMPPHGYRLGRLRFEVEPDALANVGSSNHHHHYMASLPSVWEAFVDLDLVLVQQQSGQVLSLPVVLANDPTNVMGHLSVTVRLTSPKPPTVPPAVEDVSPAAGLVALVGLATQEPTISPALDALASPTNYNEQARRRAGQLATMGLFYTQGYLDYHMQQIRTVDSNAMDERAKVYHAALQQTATPDRPLCSLDRSPRNFRPSSSRSEQVLSGIPFNCHTATLQVSLITAQERRDAAYFYNVTCGAPADHAKGFANIFRKDTEKLGLVSPVGPVSGGLRRLEAKRLELVKVVDDLQTMIIMQVANFFVTQRQKNKTVNHVPTRDAELHHLRWKLFEAVQSLHHVTWQCAVRRANVFSQALGLAVTCFLASVSDVGKWQSTWPDMWAQQGYLVCFEGLLSAAGKELGMIEDASVGIDMLKNVQIALVKDDGGDPTTNGRYPVPHSPYLKWVRISTKNQNVDGPTEYFVQIGVLPSYYDQRVPGNFKHGATVRLFPLLFEVGVDIRQWGAHAASNAKNNMRKSESGEQLGSDKEGDSSPMGLLDDEDDDVGVADDDVLVQLNFEAFQKLNAYAHRISPANSPNSSQKVHPLLETLHQHILSSSGTINHDILDEAATLSQQLGGGAVVFCKSGKDRTAMHVTYKQAQFANRYKRNWSPDAPPAVILENCLEDATIIRTYGTRLPICEKNVGQAKFAFNSLQVKFMPEKLKPPMSTLAGFLKGGKVFTGGIES